MNILFITPTLPYPPDSGSKIVYYNTIRYLSKQHSITLLSFIQAGQENYIHRLRDFCSSIETIRIDIRFTTKGLLSNLFSSVPYNMRRYSSAEMKSKVIQIVDKGNFDLVVVEHLHMAQYGDLIRNVPVFLREHNVESTMMERFYRNTKNPLKRAYAYVQWRKLKRYEVKLLSNVDRCIVLSAVDQELLRMLSPDINNAVIPCGVDLEYFKPWPCERAMDTIVYIGNLFFRPHLEGVRYFLRRVWPLLKKSRPELQFCIVGRYPPKRKNELADHPGVILKGYVEDVRPYMANSGLMVVPLWIGSGVRLKILEAMAMRLPVVATPVGYEGLEVLPGEHLLVAENHEDFKEKILALIDIQELRSKLVDNSYRLIKEKYSWEMVIKQFNSLYRDFITN